jgi:hypothetical protein
MPSHSAEEAPKPKSLSLTVQSEYEYLVLHPIRAIYENLKLHSPSINYRSRLFALRFRVIDTERWDQPAQPDPFQGYLPKI